MANQVDTSKKAALGNGMKKASFSEWFNKRIIPNRYLFFMFLPGLLYFIIFHYIPMFGIVVAFKDYSPYLGFVKSPWVGFKHFISFFSGPYAWRVIRNTLLLNIYSLLVGFPAPIILALILNELRGEGFKRVIQTITYFPYFLSFAIIAGLVVQMLSPPGIINLILIEVFGKQPILFLTYAKYFRTIYVFANIWKSLGFNAIIYFAAIAGIDPTLYEVAIIDGAGRFNRMRHVTIPGITPTIIILFLLHMGHLLTVGIELILLLYNPLTYETADVIGTFVFRRGLAGAMGMGGGLIAQPNFGLGASVGLFQSFIGLILIITANKIAKSISETSLW